MDSIYSKLSGLFSGWFSKIKQLKANESVDKQQSSPSKPTICQLMINIPIWTSKTASQRKHRIDEFLHLFPFFFGSMLDDKDLQKMLLIEKDNCVLVTASRLPGEKSTTHRKWVLIYVADEKQTLASVEVCYRSQKFLLYGQGPKRLEEFMREHNLKPIERQFEVKADQICDRKTLEPGAKPMNFPIDQSLLLLGQLNSNFLKLDDKRRLPVLTINVHEKEMTEEKCKRLANEARKMLNFGSSRIWRIWAIDHEAPTKLTLVMEDIVQGSLIEHIRQNRSAEQLVRFSIQMSEALRYLEKFEFIHGRLTLDCFLLTYSENIKLTVFGMCDWTLMPECDDHDEIDRCRWLSPECLPHQIEGMERVPYSLTSMIYTFGLILWSMHHGAILPFEDQRAEHITSAEIRLKNDPECEAEMMSKDLTAITQSCWSFPPDCRPKFKELKHSLRQLYPSKK